MGKMKRRTATAREMAMEKGARMKRVKRRREKVKKKTRLMTMPVRRAAVMELKSLRLSTKVFLQMMGHSLVTCRWSDLFAIFIFGKADFHTKKSQLSHWNTDSLLSTLVCCCIYILLGLENMTENILSP